MNQHLDAAIGFNAEGMAGSGHGFQHATDRCEHGCLTGRLRHDAYALPQRAGGEHRIASRFQIHQPAGDRRQDGVGVKSPIRGSPRWRIFRRLHIRHGRVNPPRHILRACVLVCRDHLRLGGARRRAVPEQHRQHHRHYKRNGDGQRVHPHPIEHRNRQQRGEGECRSRNAPDHLAGWQHGREQPAEHRAGHSAGRAAGEQPAVDAAVMQMDAVQAQFRNATQQSREQRPHRGLPHGRILAAYGQHEYAGGGTEAGEVPYTHRTLDEVVAERLNVHQYQGVQRPVQTERHEKRVEHRDDEREQEWHVRVKPCCGRSQPAAEPYSQRPDNQYGERKNDDQ